LRQAIWRKEDPRWKVCGIPEVLYTDNGSDFASRHLEQVSADLKIRLVFSTPGIPRGRGRIERFFSSVDQMFLCTLPGFKSSGGKKRLTLAEFDVLLREFILETYHERPHGETGVAPAQRWEQGGFLPRMPEALEQLDLLLLTVPTARKVHPDGIRFQGLRYIDTTLAAYIGESVTLRYDPRDAAEVRVFYQDRFLCRAICPELAGTVITLQDVLKARKQRRRGLLAKLRERTKAVDQLMELKRNDRVESDERPATEQTEKRATGPRLKRYRNE
jgi:putative transposase